MASEPKVAFRSSNGQAPGFDRLLEACSRIPIVTIGSRSVTLQFECRDVQTEMFRSDPLDLVSAYTRDMAQFTEYVPNPGSIVMIGLGGGALAKWCLHRFPDAEITVIEINEHVIRLRDIFRIPANNAHFRVVCAEGADFLSSTQHQPDVLLVDGFDYEGQPPQLCTEQFYDDCFRVLRPDGVLVVNLCDSDEVTLRALTEKIQQAFGSQVRVLQEQPGNQIIFARKRTQSAIYYDGALSFSRK